MPVEFSTPTFAYSSPPMAMIFGTDATVSTLLTSVGDAYSPSMAGNGGFVRGLPRLPSSESRSAVSSPQM